MCGVLHTPPHRKHYYFVFFRMFTLYHPDSTGFGPDDSDNVRDKFDQMKCESEVNNTYGYTNSW